MRPIDKARLLREATAKVAKIGHFRDGLLGEAADDMRRLKNLPR
jgi:hypothetical protein